MVWRFCGDVVEVLCWIKDVEVLWRCGGFVDDVEIRWRFCK